METLTNIHCGEETKVKLIDLIESNREYFQPVVLDFYSDLRIFFKFKLNELGFDCFDVNEFYSDTNVLRLFEFDIPQLDMSVPDSLEKKFKHRFAVELAYFDECDVIQLYLWDNHYLKDSKRWSFSVKGTNQNDYPSVYASIKSKILKLLDSTKNMLPYADIITHINSRLLQYIGLPTQSGIDTYEAYPILRLADYEDMQLLATYIRDSYRYDVKYHLIGDNLDTIEYTISRKIANMSAEPKILSANLNELVENVEGCEINMFVDSIISNL